MNEALLMKPEAIEAPSPTSTEILDKLYVLSTRLSLASHVWHSAVDDIDF